jgi:hypothetical protein
MIVHALSAPPAVELARALERFELGFTYPLGGDTRFRISHGTDYGLFFRAMGESTVFVAVSDGEVMGTLAAAVREARSPDGVKTKTLYIGDLKVVPGIMAGVVLIRLGAELKRWAENRVISALGVVMGGTTRTPERYTGRFGIPEFAEIGEILILRFSCERLGQAPERQHRVTEDVGHAILQSLTGSEYLVCGGDPRLRSEMTPVWLGLPSGSACGMLEDTARAKRLFELGGPELRSAHVSHLAYDSPHAGAMLLRQAIAAAAAHGFPALFCAVPGGNASALVEETASLSPTLAPAKVYGAGLPRGLDWRINTSEI